MPHYNMITLEEFNPGDVFIKYGRDIGDQRLIKWGQFLFGYEHYEFVHAGIFISNDQFIEMTKDGMQITSVEDGLMGERFVLFRCKTTEIAEYAADLAANIQQSAISYLTKNKGYVQPPSYSLTNAITSVVNFGGINRYGHYDPVVNFKVPKDFYCSELVAYLYSMSYFHLDKKSLGREIINRIGRKDLSPSTLYSLLSQSTDFSQKEICFHSQCFLPSRLSVQKADEGIPGEKTQAFKEKVEQLKSSSPIEREHSQENKM